MICEGARGVCPCCRQEPNIDHMLDKIEEKARDIVRQLQCGVISREEIHLEVEGELSDFVDEVEECGDFILEDLKNAKC